MMSSSYTKSTSAISFPTGEYNDKYVDLKQYVSRLEQGFSVNNIDAFIGAKDTRINNYSSFIMSDKGLLSTRFRKERSREWRCLFPGRGREGEPVGLLQKGRSDRGVREFSYGLLT